MKRRVHAGVLAPLSVLIFAASASAVPTVPSAPQSVLPLQQGTEPSAHALGNSTSFDDAVAQLRSLINQRLSRGAISGRRAATLNAMLDRAVGVRDRYIAQGRRLTPEQMATLRGRLDRVKAATRGSLQFQ